MSSENECSKCGCGSKSSSTATWITLITVAGVTAAAAYVIAKRVRAKGGNVEHLFDTCERAARTLDDRLGVKEALYAVG